MGLAVTGLAVLVVAVLVSVVGLMMRPSQAGISELGATGGDLTVSRGLVDFDGPPQIVAVATLGFDCSLCEFESEPEPDDEDESAGRIGFGTTSVWFARHAKAGPAPVAFGALRRLWLAELAARAPPA